MTSSDVLAPVQQMSLADVVTERIREAIIRGQLRPGERLSEPGVAAQMGVSRSPVREALHRLESERLVSGRTNHSHYVWAPTDADVDEIFSLRVMIESLAAEWMIEKLTAEDFAALEAMIEGQRRLLDNKDYLGITHEDKRFHEYMCRRANHVRLADWWHQIMGQWEVLIYRRMENNPPDVELTMLNDHTNIVDALRAQDLRRVVALHRTINARVSQQIKHALLAAKGA